MPRIFGAKGKEKGEEKDKIDFKGSWVLVPVPGRLMTSEGRVVYPGANTPPSTRKPPSIESWLALGPRVASGAGFATPAGGGAAGARATASAPQ